MLRLTAMACAVAVIGACNSQTTETDAATGSSAGDKGFAGVIWRETTEGAALGAMQIFLPEGALLSDSCWETYRISNWRREGPDEVAWSEDGEDIKAKILSLEDDTLILELQLRGGPERKTYSAAAAPYVCPDMPR